MQNRALIEKVVFFLFRYVVGVTKIIHWHRKNFKFVYALKYFPFKFCINFKKNKISNEHRCHYVPAVQYYHFFYLIKMIPPVISKQFYYLQMVARVIVKRNAVNLTLYKIIYILHVLFIIYLLSCHCSYDLG